MSNTQSRIQEQIEREYEMSDTLKQAALRGAEIALENQWIRERDKKPAFDTWVLCYCGIYGFYIGCYQQIEDTGYGNWNDGKEFGVLPPLFWQPLPTPPKP